MKSAVLVSITAVIILSLVGCRTKDANRCEGGGVEGWPYDYWEMDDIMGHIGEPDGARSICMFPVEATRWEALRTKQRQEKRDSLTHTAREGEAIDLERLRETESIEATEAAMVATMEYEMCISYYGLPEEKCS